MEFTDSEELEGLQAIRDVAGMDALTVDEQAMLGEDMPAGDPGLHSANLAEFVDEKELDRLADLIKDWVDWDEQSRQDWSDREQRGIRMLGVSDKTEGGATFEGASRVVHPLLHEAVIQFQARALAELWPATGPVKGRIVGKQSEELIAQKERVEDYLNYLYTTAMPGAFEEEDKLLYRLPLSGSVFTKVYYCPLEQTVIRRLVEPADFIVPYSATDLRTAPRYTHRIRVAHNDLLRMMNSGYYRKIDKLISPDEDVEYPGLLDEIKQAEGVTRTDYRDDQRHTLLECHCYVDLAGFEDTDELGEKTGIGQPYIITLERDSLEVLAIRRNWKEDDADKRKRVYFTHYYMLPGLGFYGYGLLHVLGGLEQTATGAIRALLDAAAFANLPGGYKTRDAKIEGGDVPIAPGEWREVQCTMEDLQKGFFSLPYKEPSQTLFNLLNYIDETGRRVAGTVEVMVGEQSRQQPVGTTLALIEQASKPQTAVHKRLHEAHAREFQLTAELVAEFMPPLYPYAQGDEERYVLAEDFDGRIDVIPVSDPNIVSNVQRISQAQAVLQLAAQFPNIYDAREANKMMLEALRVQNIDEVLPEQEESPRVDAVEENMRVLMGKPIEVFPDQEHTAHLMAHQQFLMSQPPELQQMIQPAMMAHIAAHHAWLYRLQVQQTIGMQLPPPVSLQGDDADDQGEMPPELDYQISVAAAQAAQVMMQQQQAMQPQQPDPMAMAQADEARKDMETARKIKRQDAEAAAKIKRDNAIAEAQAKLRASQSLGEQVQQRNDELMGKNTMDVIGQ